VPSEGLGYRDVVAHPVSHLAATMRNAPTGNQLAIDGNLVLPYTTVNPSLSILAPSEGTAYLWNDSGTLRIRVYSRATGWMTA